MKLELIKYTYVVISNNKCFRIGRNCTLSLQSTKQVQAFISLSSVHRKSSSGVCGIIRVVAPDYTVRLTGVLHVMQTYQSKKIYINY